MKIYIDIIMLLNFFFDFILLLTVSIVLKRNASIKRIIFGAFIGGLSMLFLFFEFTTFTLFIFKIFISILMVLITFGYYDLKYTFKNILYLYSTSMILGGFLYFLNVTFSYKQKGLIFINNGLSVNFVFLIISSPIILYLYIKQGIWLKHNYNNYYDVTIYVSKKEIKCKGFLDTGNNLVDPITKKAVLLIDIKIDVNYYFIPYTGVSRGLIKCFKADKVIINEKEYEKVIIGILDNKIKIDGVDCLLNKKLLEE